MNAINFHRNINLYELGVPIDKDTLDLYNHIKSIYHNLKEYHIKNKKMLYYGNSTDDIVFYYSKTLKCLYLCISRILNEFNIIDIQDILKIYISKEYNLDIENVHYIGSFINRHLTESIK